MYLHKEEVTELIAKTFPGYKIQFEYKEWARLTVHVKGDLSIKLPLGKLIIRHIINWGEHESFWFCIYSEHPKAEDLYGPFFTDKDALTLLEVKAFLIKLKDLLAKPR